MRKDKMLPTTVARIIDLLEERGISAKDYLEKMGLNRSAMTDWKSLKSKPTAETIRKTAEMFDVTTDYLMGLSDNIDPMRVEDLPPLYFKLAKDAKRLELTERDIEFLLEIAAKYKRMNSEEEK